MKKFILVLLFVFIYAFVMLEASSLQNESKPLSIKLKRTALISDEKIAVSDLLELWEGELDDLLKIKNIIIDILPYQKRMINISSSKVLNKIKSHHPDLKIMISDIITAVRWEEYLLKEDLIKKEAVEFLKGYYPLSENAEFTFTNVPKIHIPSDDIILSFKHNRTTENTNFIRLDGFVYFDGEIINVFNILCKIQDKQYVFQANKSIRKGQKISSSDFLKVMVAISPNSSYIMEIDESTETVANNFIPKGAYLKNSDVKTAPHVYRNDLVNVLIRSTSMFLSYEAIARTDGWIGDRIMLQNPDSKKDFYALVIDKNKVLISLED